MRVIETVAVVMLGAGICAGCAGLKAPVEQFEPSVAVAPPVTNRSGATDWVFTSIPTNQLDTRRRRSREWLGTERTLFLRLHDDHDEPIGYANVICLGSRLGAMTDESGVAWLHGMTDDTTQVRFLVPPFGTTTRQVVIGQGQLVGLDVQAPPFVKPKYFSD